MVVVVESFLRSSLLRKYSIKFKHLLFHDFLGVEIEITNSASFQVFDYPYEARVSTEKFVPKPNEKNRRFLSP